MTEGLHNVQLMTKKGFSWAPVGSEPAPKGSGKVRIKSIEEYFCIITQGTGYNMMLCVTECNREQKVFWNLHAMVQNLQSNELLLREKGDLNVRFNTRKSGSITKQYPSSVPKTNRNDK